MTAKYNTTLTQERLKEVLDYDPDTGVFTWKIRTSNRVQVGDVAGCLNKISGYIVIGVGGVLHRSHRLAVLWMTNTWPPHDVDHRDGVRSNNKWKNLRAVTNDENHQNLKLWVTNTTGYMGVHFDKDNQCYSAQIAVKGKRHRVGRFGTAEEASTAYLAAKRKLHVAQPIPRHLLEKI